jgi:hypothetical protein
MLSFLISASPGILAHIAENSQTSKHLQKHQILVRMHTGNPNPKPKVAFGKSPKNKLKCIISVTLSIVNKKMFFRMAKCLNWVS